jgi:hypothetical protein
MGVEYPTKASALNPVAWEKSEMGPRAKLLYERYVQSISEDYSEIDLTPLVVLVWGPGPCGGVLFEKRKQIRGMLVAQGDVALFSEELDETCRNFAGSARAKELVQANRADFIVVLYSSPGSVAEVHDFGQFMNVLGTKMLIFIDSDNVAGYGYSGLLSELQTALNNVCTYRYPEDIRDCHLVGAVNERLAKLRIAKWWAAQKGLSV